MQAKADLPRCCIACSPRSGSAGRCWSEQHSLTFGFDLHTTLRRILVYYGERLGDRMDYLAIFPIGGVMRTNLFCYADPGDPWVKLFKRDPKQALLGVMPSLEQTIGPFEIAGKAQVRPNSIHRADNAWQREGVVLIGDAYQFSGRQSERASGASWPMWRL